MAIHLEANYSKKLGLANYSSHQYSVTIKTEVGDLGQVQVESSRLYNLLQSCVDREIQNTGFLPGNNGNNGQLQQAPAGQVNARSNGIDAWACSPKQRDLILKIVEENNFDKNQVEALAQERFSKSVRALNKLEASGLIDELLTQTGNSTSADRRRSNGRSAVTNSR